jgi:uncharacterized protein YbbK (DUF523 family)
LVGINCKYDGKSRICPKLVEMVKRGEAIPVCPEILGGLPTPRIPSEQKNDRVINKNGEDVTEQFNKGAEETLNIAQMVGATEAILKARSPSCGANKVYDGTFTHTIVDGDGVTAKLLKTHGIKVKTEEEIGV